MSKHERDTRCKPRSLFNETHNTNRITIAAHSEFSLTPKPDYTPTFLDIISGISEMVAFHTDHDQISDDRFLLSEKMSGKKCRFCS